MRKNTSLKDYKLPVSSFKMTLFFTPEELIHESLETKVEKIRNIVDAEGGITISKLLKTMTTIDKKYYEPWYEYHGWYVFDKWDMDFDVQKSRWRLVLPIFTMMDDL